MKTLYTQHTKLSHTHITKQLQLFYQEDQAHKDLSTIFTTKKTNPNVTAQLIVEEDLVIAGLPIADVMFGQHNVLKNTTEGSFCKAGDVVCSISAPANLLLSYERILLNLLQRMSGIASLTHKYVTTLDSSTIKILDTRKTTPGLRLFEKYAVCMGGGHNHRFDLYDGVMIKDNHLVIIGNLNNALYQLKESHPNKKIQIEVDTFNQLKTILQSLSHPVDAILLDNMNNTETKQCAQLIRQTLPQCFIESSGGITLNNITQYKDTDIDGLSIGALTHQATSKNITFELQNL